jgi:hypothetical protein
LVGVALNTATGAGTLTVIKLACTLVLEPPGPLTTNWIVFVPAPVYWCVIVVPDALAVVPSPNCHDRLVMLPVDVSVNVTVNGTVPLVGAALNDAMGAGVLFPTIIKLACTLVLEPPGPLTTNWTVSVPAVVYW